MKNKNIYLWISDAGKDTGEGQLANKYLENLIKNKYTFKIIKKSNNNLIKILLEFRYIIPFIGIFFCWKFFLQNKKVGYINYLPFWNFLIFLLLPPKTLLGPITGGANFNNDNFLIRKYIFPIFYKISETIVNLRSYNLLFSTELLKKYLSKKTKKKSTFNFIIKQFSYKIKKKKDIDFLIYYRNHKNKKSFFPYNLINNLLLLKFKVHIVGDKLNLRSVTNYNFINNKKLGNLQSRARFTVISNENLYSLFTLESIAQNVKVLINKSVRTRIVYFKKSFLKINFNNLKELNKLKKIYK